MDFGVGVRVGHKGEFVVTRTVLDGQIEELIDVRLLQLIFIAGRLYVVGPGQFRFQHIFPVDRVTLVVVWHLLQLGVVVIILVVCFLRVVIRRRFRIETGYGTLVGIHNERFALVERKQSRVITIFQGRGSLGDFFHEFRHGLFMLLLLMLLLLRVGRTRGGAQNHCHYHAPA